MRMEQSKPTGAFIGASWAAMGIGLVSFCVGLWNAGTLVLSEKGFYLSVMILGFYSTISLAKTVRDKSEGLPVTNVYAGLSWAAFAAACALLVIGLWNADILLSEKGFYGLAYTLSIFGAMAVQKNIRDANGDLNFPSLRREKQEDESLEVDKEAI